jgi:pilus assembly protein CpaE
MSTEEANYVSVLLPAATVALFSRDAQSVEAFRNLAADWRFARVGLQVHDGGVAEAISAYQAARSPQLIIIQTETIDASLTEQLEALSAHCAEGTSAIVVGPVNDVNLYRRLIGMGVSDYLVKPLQGPVLANDIAKSLIDQMGAGGSRLIAMIGSKGGTGVTVLSEALAWGIADTLGQKTFLLDAAGGWSSLAVGMDFEPATTLAEAARAAAEGNRDALSRMVHSASDKLSVLSSGGDTMLEENASPENYEALLDYLMVAHPVVVADLSAASPTLKHIALSRANEIMLVTAPTLPSVRAARSLIQEIRDVRGGSDAGIDVILNMQGFAPRSEVPKNQIEQGLGRKLSAALPFDPELFVQSEAEGKKISSVRNGGAIAAQLLPIARRFTGLAAEAANADSGEGKKGALGGILGKLRSK